MSAAVPRAAIVAALEALKAGDHRFAAQVLLDALEGAPAKRFKCESCGARFRWPGQLEDHLLRSRCWRPLETRSGRWAA